MNGRFLVIGMMVLSLGGLLACGSERDEICEPGTYRCAGPQGNLLQRCVSRADLWETLANCEDVGQVCREGSCVAVAADGDAESAEAASESCSDDAACSEGSVCESGECVARAGLRADLDAGTSRLIVRLDTGRASLFDTKGAVRLLNASAEADLIDPQGRTRVLRLDDAEATRSVATRSEGDALGLLQGLWITRQPTGDEPALTWRFSAYAAEGFYTVSLRLEESAGATGWKVVKLLPLVANAANEGGLFLGASPSTQRILENGAFSRYDTQVRLVPGDTPAETVSVPGNYLGHSVSNWNEAILDLGNGSVWVAGALGFADSLPVFSASYDAASAPKSADGRTGYGLWAAENAYLPAAKALSANGTFSSEVIYVHPAETSVFEGLERYARKVKASLGVTLWVETSGRRVPACWNSWTGGATGGYGAGIDEATLLANLDVAGYAFRDWGLSDFLVGPGWQTQVGDWQWDATRFPHGGAWMAQQIRAAGLTPALWMAPFSAAKGGTLAANHPDWLLATDTDATSDVPLDPSRDAVQSWLGARMDDVHAAWGFDRLDLDEGAPVLLGTSYATGTREEAYRAGVKALRSGLGSDAFVLVRSLTGLSYGLAEAGATGDVNVPVWDHAANAQAEGLGHGWSGFKPAVRAAARRYYLNNRLWVNAPGALFLRSDASLTETETRAFAAFVGISGGLVELGDKLPTLTGPQINLLRQLLPVYPESATPLDLFAREIPERWHLPIRYGLDGYAEAYEVVGLFNWGANRDLTTNPYTDLADSTEAADRRVTLAELGLPSDDPGAGYLAFEFWTQSYLGRVTSDLTVSVPAHDSRLVALRRDLGVPQFLGFNRQLTMGGVELKSSAWDASTRHLTIALKAVGADARAPFTYSLSVHVPKGYTYGSATSSGVRLGLSETAQAGEVLTVRFVPERSGTLTYVLSFPAK